MNDNDRGDETAAEQRTLQDQLDRRERDDAGGGERPAMQAGGRVYPVPPFAKQHQPKPGSEAALDPAPMYDAPFYKGSGKLQDKVAIITGGDSGIGRAVAVLFAREGADVAIAHLDEDDDAETTRQAVEAEGRRGLVISGDVRDRAFCRDLVERVVREFGKLDILVNNAAFQLHARKIEEIEEAHFDETLRTNLYGYFFMAQAALAHLPPGGAIINTGSVTAMRGSKNLLDYSMTKGGIHTFTRSLAAHVADRGVRVNAVAPGPVWTPLNPADGPEEKVETFGSDTLMKRPAQPEELAPAYVFLASAHCSGYITGEILPVIGGYA